MTLLGKEGSRSQVIIWNIRLPRIIAGVAAGIGLSVAGCGVEFTYLSRVVLKKIRFIVEKGDFLVILGPNGVGKSTLLKCINKILKPKRERYLSKRLNSGN
jgi:ABC-type multidrug transport system fused ATPase/permease subunit